MEVMNVLETELKVEELNEEQLKNIDGGMSSCQTYRTVEKTEYWLRCNTLVAV